MEDSTSITKESSSANSMKNLFSLSLSTKRAKTSNASRLSLNRLLDPLDKQQVATVLTSLIQRHPHLYNEVATHIPGPTVDSLQLFFQDLERKLVESFPYTRTGPSHDDYAYQRVRPILKEIRETLLEYGDHFDNPQEHTATRFNYLALACGVIQRLPAWDNPAHEKDREELYENMREYFVRVVKDAESEVKEGKVFGAQMVSEWARILVQQNEVAQGKFAEVLEKFRVSLGWMIGL